MAQSELHPNAKTTQLRPAASEPQIRIVFDKFQAFVHEYRPKISLGGVFLESSQPHPVGTRVSCEFQLADGFRLCRAVGEVAWLRPTAGAPDQPAGMGVRFLALDDQGRELILKILEEQVKGGGEPFEVEQVPVDAVTSPPPSPREDPASTRPRQSPLPGPQEDPASTHSRPAVVVASGPLTDVEAPQAAAAEDDFKAPWGQELPGLPDDVIEPPLDADALATAYEDFDSDLSEAEFAADMDLLDEVADEVSFSDEALDESLPTRSEVPSFDVPSFGAEADASAEPQAFGPEGPGFDDVDVPLAPEPVESGYSAPAPDSPFAATSKLIDDLGLSSAEGSGPVGADDETSISHFGLPEPPSSHASSWAASEVDGAWEGADEDEEWDEAEESGLRSGLHRMQITVQESSGRFIVILCLLVAVVAALIFKEQILAWVGLGSPPAQEVSGAPLADPGEEPLPPSPAAAGAAASQEPSELESAASADRPELIEVGSETPAETAAASPEPPPRSPLGEPQTPNDERPAGAAAMPEPRRTGSRRPASRRPATRVESITFDQAAEGTRVTVLLDGSVAEGQYQYQELSYDPRKEQLVVSGIGTPYASTIVVGTLELDRIRTGLHQGNRLNLVFDLSSEHMTLAEIRSRDDRLEILVRRR